VLFGKRVPISKRAMAGEEPSTRRDEEENERSRGSSGRISGAGVGRGCAGQVEEDAGHRPLFQAREAWAATRGRSVPSRRPKEG